MKKLTFLILTLISIFSCSNAQTYDFLNQTLVDDKHDLIYLKTNYLKLDNYIDKDFFSIANFKEVWKELPSKDTPNIELFLNNFNFSYIKASLVKNKKDSLIDFKKLNKNILPFDFIGDKTELSISKPIFNHSKRWVIIVKSSFNKSKNAGGSGFIYIYRKIKGNWVLYHSFNLWL